MDTYLTLPEAEKLTNYPEQVLQQLATSGIIRTIMYTNGMLLNQQDVISQVPREQREDYKQFMHLSGHGVSIREASRRLGIDSKTMSRWVKRGYIRILSKQGRSILIDLGDASYCAHVYKSNPGQGRWTFTTGGIPYPNK